MTVLRKAERDVPFPVCFVDQGRHKCVSHILQTFDGQLTILSVDGINGAFDHVSRNSR